MPIVKNQIDFSNYQVAKRAILIQLQQWHWQIAYVEEAVRTQRDFEAIIQENQRLRSAIRDSYQANQTLSRREPMAAQRLHRRYLRVLLDLSSQIVSIPSKSMAYYDLIGFKDHLLRAIDYIEDKSPEEGN
ncbi:hypothetical protein HC026_11610 [Lactobacillus sp. LC28-10]|uniref:Uncharacterized protein n=1 Tax=Secundilactobacillus angelensis TaxID=2722706 RepID=A0ABX1L5J8_9LACO|nr:hypothetical protein [Secundilactobacillus angelensis]MCH5463171.1 hypothetical protein [Secundilactobacillus angelensis]NLR19536.1 hypothetical protein [Secundilactobacillus angelensis]